MKGMGCSLFKPDLSTRRPRRLSAHGAAIHPRECREYVGTQPNLKSLSHYAKACFQASMTLSWCSLQTEPRFSPARAAPPGTSRWWTGGLTFSPGLCATPQSAHFLSQVSALWRCWHFPQQSCSIALLSTKPERGGNELLSLACPLPLQQVGRVS